MKKIYALAAVACMAASAMAQNGAPLYATGGGGFDPQWDPASPAEFTYENGEYVLEVTNIDGLKISTAKGDWELFNGGAIGVDQVTAIDTWTPIAAWGENTRTPWKGDYTIKVKGDLSEIWMHTDTPEPTEAPFVCFRGDATGGWDDNLADWAFTTLDGKKEYVGDAVYKFTCGADQVIKASESFKVGLNTTWNVVNLGNAPAGLILLDEETILENGANPDAFKLDEECDGVCYVNLQLTAEVPGAVIFFSNDKDAANPFEEGAVKTVNVENNGVASYFNLQGVRVANPENGLFIVVKDGKATKIVK